MFPGRGFERSLPYSHVSRVSRRVDASPAKVVQTIPRPALYKYSATFTEFLSFIPLPTTFSLPHINASPYIMRFLQQKASRTGYGTAFVGLRNPVLHFALATGFLALQPAMNGYAPDNGLRPATVGNGPVTLAGRIKGVMHKVTVPSPTRNARKAPRVRGPTKVHRLGPSSIATSSPSTSTGKTTIIYASLVSLGVGAALALGSSNVQGDPSAGEESSGNGRDNDTGDESGQNGLGEFYPFSSSPIPDLIIGDGSPPPGDNPDDPSGTSNGAGMPRSLTLFSHGVHLSLGVSSKPMTYYTRDGGGSPPPPPPPGGTAIDNDNSGPTPSTFGPITLLVLLSYLLCRRALDSRKKAFGSSQANISSTFSHSMPDVDFSFDAYSGILDLAKASSPLVVEVQPTLDSFEDFIGNESVPFASLDITPILEIALSASAFPAAIEFWNADVAQRIPVALHEPMPASSNVLQLHEVRTCSADDNPHPSSPSALLHVIKIFLTLFAVLFCGIVVYLLSYITSSGFGNDATPEDMNEVEVSFASLKNHVSI